jgi:hypothetical protein
VPEPIRVDQPKQFDPKLSFTAVPPRQRRSKPTLISAVARLYWMLAGNAALYLLALAIAQQRQQASTKDVAFFAVVASLILVRYLDIAWLGGATASGKPASLGDWYRYVAGCFRFPWPSGSSLALRRGSASCSRPTFQAATKP